MNQKTAYLQIIAQEIKALAIGYEDFHSTHVGPPATSLHGPSSPSTGIVFSPEVQAMQASMATLLGDLKNNQLPMLEESVKNVVWQSQKFGKPDGKWGTITNHVLQSIADFAVVLTALPARFNIKSDYTSEQANSFRSGIVKDLSEKMDPKTQSEQAVAISDHLQAIIKLYDLLQKIIPHISNERVLDSTQKKLLSQSIFIKTDLGNPISVPLDGLTSIRKFHDLMDRSNIKTKEEQLDFLDKIINMSEAT
jgi:hypothetical protein